MHRLALLLILLLSSCDTLSEREKAEIMFPLNAMIQRGEITPEVYATLVELIYSHDNTIIEISITVVVGIVAIVGLLVQEV